MILQPVEWASVLHGSDVPEAILVFHVSKGPGEAPNDALGEDCNPVAASLTIP